MSESWRAVADYEGLYEVSDLGRVRRASTKRGTRARAGTILKPIKHPAGYLKVHLRDAGRDRQVLIHILVAEAFLGPPPEGKGVNHKNGIKPDCRAENIEYSTQLENVHHAMDVLGHSNAGVRHGLAILTEPEVLAIRARRAAGAKLAVVAAEFGIAEKTVSDIALRKRWKHI